MNKQIILNALHMQLHMLESDLMFDKLEAAFLWDKCDKAKPVTTELYYTDYKAYKNRIRATQDKLRRTRETIRQVKKIK